KAGARMSAPGLTEAEEALARNEVDAVLSRQDGEVRVEVEGSDPMVTAATMRSLRDALTSQSPLEGAGPEGGLRSRVLALVLRRVLGLGTLSPPKITYLHGDAAMTSFDNLGPVLLGILVFLFTFFVSGLSFVRERTSGTLERMLATPLRRHEVVFGYMLGFAL